MPARSAVRSALVAALEEIQVQSGDPVAAIKDETQPLQDLEGFDSLRAVELEVTLSAKLGKEVKELPIKNGKTGVPLTVREILDHVCQTLGMN